MAYDQGHQQQRPYNGPAASRPVPQRQYPPAGGPPQQHDQYREEHGYDDHGGGQGYGQEYDAHYDDMGYGGRPDQSYPPPQEYGPGPGSRPGPGPGGPPGRGHGRPIMPRGRGSGPPGPMQRSAGPYPPRGGGPPGPGRGGYPGGGRGRPGPPLDRAGGSDPSMNRGRMNPPPRSPLEAGFGEQQIRDGMEGMDISGRRPPPSQDRRGPPRPYPPQGHPDQRRAPGPGPAPDPGYGAPGGGGGDQDDGFGPPGRAMTMPTHAPSLDMRGGPPPPRSESAPYNGPYSRGPPGPPPTAQAARPPPQRMHPGAPPPHGGAYGGPDYGSGPQDQGYGQQQQRPASFDDFYDNYYDDRGSSEYPADNPPPAHADIPDFDAAPQRPRDSFEQSMAAPPPGQEQAQRGPNRYPVVSKAKSQPDLRQSQEAVFEMAGDIPPVPAQYGGHDGYDQQPYGNGPGQPPVRPGPDALPSHPTPVRPGLMANPRVNMGNKPPPVRNYQGGGAGGHPPVPLVATPSGPRPSPEQEQAAVTPELLERFRNIIKADPNDQITALLLAKKLVEASDVLVPNLPDPRARAKSRERYLLDAHKILKKLSNVQNTEAMFFLADCLGRGLFSAEPDNKEAFTLYQSAAKLGSAAAAYRTAVCCEIGNEEGGGTRKDPLKAMQWYKRAATLGDTPAMYKVGMILLKGLLGQAKNPREAVGWLKRAAERADAENPHALHELGLLYESAQPNDAILRDEPYAFTLFQQAAELGYKFSQFRLGCAFEYGLMGCPVDPRLSIMWYSRAATQEEHQGELALSGWYLTGSEGVLQQSDTEAYLWARKAAMAGLAKAEYAMGYFTEVGIGIPANLEDAKRWYWRAAAQDFPKARERLEDLKRAGRNAPRQRERISRSKIGKQQEGECVVM